MKNLYFLGLLLPFLGWPQGGFTKVVDAANPITTFTSPGVFKGASWVDIDNDDDLDLFAGQNNLFRNDGGTFVKLVDPFGFTFGQNPGGASWADLDHDGNIDCIIAQYPSTVQKNNGDGTFTNITATIDGLANYPSWGCGIGDWNKDAYPDFVFAHAAGFSSVGTFPSKLYLNTSAALTPQAITGYEITDQIQPFTVPYWSDYDLDGDMDLFVASGPGGSAGLDFCYKNLKVENGSDALERMTAELFASQLQDGQCYNFIDYDNDGDFDLCLSNWNGAPSRFYVNSNGTYIETTTAFSIQNSNLSNNWGDFDNDGDLDVMVTNANSGTKYYVNNNGTFADAISIGTAGAAGITNGDYDNDGDLDIFIHGQSTGRALFNNTSAASGNNWVTIKCVGTVSNTSAIGAIVRLKATINGNVVWQIREINAQNSFLSQNELRVHFGLGDAVNIEEIRIKYPSGIEETFTNISPNFFYTNIENSGVLGLAANLIGSDKQITVYPNPAQDTLYVGFAKKPQNTVTLSIVNLNGKIVSRKDYEPQRTISTDISKLAKGTYLLSVGAKSMRVSVKFLKN
jgi:hypothetical protein